MKPKGALESESSTLRGLLDPHSRIAKMGRFIPRMRAGCIYMEAPLLALRSISADGMPQDHTVTLVVHKDDRGHPS